MNPHGVATATSRQRVYQFHHLDNKKAYILLTGCWQEKNEEKGNFFLMRALLCREKGSVSALMADTGAGTVLVPHAVREKADALYTYWMPCRVLSTGISLAFASRMQPCIVRHCQRACLLSGTGYGARTRPCIPCFFRLYCVLHLLPCKASITNSFFAGGACGKAVSAVPVPDRSGALS